MNELGNTPADKGYQPSGISRAEEAARKAYPYEGGTKGLICDASIPIFIQGYEQAEKDTIERTESHLESVLLNFLDMDTVKWIIKDFKKAMEEEK